MFIRIVTTTEQFDHSRTPVLFHVERDPGERYPMFGRKRDGPEYWWV